MSNLSRYSEEALLSVAMHTSGERRSVRVVKTVPCCACCALLLLPPLAPNDLRKFCTAAFASVVKPPKALYKAIIN